MPNKVYATIGFDGYIHPNSARLNEQKEPVYQNLFGVLKGDGHAITNKEILTGFDLIQKIERYNAILNQ